jgi:hypothetical protein
MGTKYTNKTISGYNATPPDDDGTVSESNKVKWATIKTKLADTIKTLAESINTALVTHFDKGPTALTSSDTLDATHYGKFVEIDGSGITITLTDAATLGAGWYCDLMNRSAGFSFTLARATASDTINDVSADITVYNPESIRVIVNAAATGFYVPVPSYFRNDSTFAKSMNVEGTALFEAAATFAALTTVNGNIKFPATQNASSNANTLDDYEEGTWTPALDYSGTPPTYEFQVGTYTKIGRLVFIRGKLSVTNKNGGSSYTIVGLPFAAKTDSYATYSVFAHSWTTLATGVLTLFGIIFHGDSGILMYGTTGATTDVTGATNTLFTDGTIIEFSGSYETD